VGPLEIALFGNGNLPTNPIIISLLTSPTPKRSILLIQPDRGDRAVSAVNDFDLVAHPAEFGAVPFGDSRGELEAAGAWSASQTPANVLRPSYSMRWYPLNYLDTYAFKLRVGK
jgi:hypothetical protein